MSASALSVSKDIGRSGGSNEWESMLERYKKFNRNKVMPPKLRDRCSPGGARIIFAAPVDPRFGGAYIAPRLWQSRASSAKTAAAVEARRRLHLRAAKPTDSRAHADRVMRPEETGFMKIRPLQDRILVKRIEGEETTKGGIIIPDTAKEKPQEGKIVAVGKGKLGDDGKVTPLDVKKGDKILFSKYAGTEVNIEGEEHLIIREDDVLGVIE
jgi:chaperonin GroES